MNRAELDSALAQLRDAIKHKKCWVCGCQQSFARTLRESLDEMPEADRREIEPLLSRSEATFRPVEYDCLGCKVCFPAIATNALAGAYPAFASGEGCAVGADDKERSGWPPLPGNYEVRRYQAAVAVCTLNSKNMIREVVDQNHPEIGIVGTLNTENLGIERLIKNIVSNPHIRFLILCGEDSRQKIGHLPGQSLASLFQHGVDKNGRIIGAEGRRPALKNIEVGHVDRFRMQVELVPMVSSMNAAEILRAADSCVGRNPGRFPDNGFAAAVPTVQAHPPERLVLDPSGYFVIFPDRSRRRIMLEHYTNDGMLSRVIEGRDIGDIYATAISLGLLSRLDHACYLGKELAKAESALASGSEYRQDKAPDYRGDATDPKCSGKGCCGENA